MSWSQWGRTGTEHGGPDKASFLIVPRLGLVLSPNLILDVSVVHGTSIRPSISSSVASRRLGLYYGIHNLVFIVISANVSVLSTIRSHPCGGGVVEVCIVMTTVMDLMPPCSQVVGRKSHLIKLITAFFKKIL